LSIEQRRICLRTAELNIKLTHVNTTRFIVVLYLFYILYLWIFNVALITSNAII